MTRFKRNIVKGRLSKLAYISFFLFVMLIMRLSWIQIVKNDEYGKAALRQRTREIEIYPSRGVIYDRNLIPLTNRYRVSTMFIFKDYAVNNDDTIKYISEHTSLSEREVKKIINSSSGIVEIPVSKLPSKSMQMKGVVIADKTYRYDKNNILTHVIGYTKKSDNTGVSGIERIFDDELRTEDGGSLYLELDNKKRIIPGGGFSYVDNMKNSKASCVKLTIDYYIQNIAEKVMDSEEKNGAVIVTDIKTGDILAMVSRPNFEQDDIDSYLKNDDMALYNKAVQVSYPPGSLFKIVVLLAALEDDPSIANEIFYCNGYEQIDDVVIKCNKQEGHGWISTKKAFAKSCNSTFIQIGKKIGSKKIIDMAKKLGFGEKLIVTFLEEINGNLPEGREILGPAIGNISIGQGNIEVTPIQITNMMMIIANDGVQKDLSIVDSIVTEDGHTVKQFRKENAHQVVSQESCRILKEYLREVVLNGTARNLNLEDIGGACGKTGSAQAVLNKKETIHGWFTGYYPEKNPKYVITVFIEQGYSGSKSAVPIFEKIAKEIFKKNR